MNGPEEFEEGMCGQDVELFRQEEGLPMNGVYDEDEDEYNG